MEFDVIIVGAGPAGLATAIRLAQLAGKNNSQLNICVLEKGFEVGAHILSGAIFEAAALTELIPDWQKRGAPVITPVTKDKFLFLTKKHAIPLPIPNYLNNKNNYVISLANLCRWLAKQAEELGVQIFPGFSANNLIYENNKIVGVTTGEFGINKNGEHKTNYQPSMQIRASYTVLAEGARGFLTEQIIEKFNLRKNVANQTYGLGIKELWKIPDTQYIPGLVTHTVGWPLTQDTYGGGFIYHLENNLVSIGMIIGLDYKNPYLSPYQELQRFKLHPKIKPLFANAERINYGARALNEGGLQSMPQLTFPGGLLVGCGAGMLNVAKIKGSHNAMRSGIIAADALLIALKNSKPKYVHGYHAKLTNSKVGHELYLTRNIRPAFHYGFWAGLTYAAFDSFILRGKAPWTFKVKFNDHKKLQPINNFKLINYPKPDNKITFDLMTSVNLSGTNHLEDQPAHLKLLDPELQKIKNWEIFGGPEQHYCPAGVYEILNKDDNPYLQINAQNCLHCKACDIKDPLQNIKWTPPEGGGGPNYTSM